MDACVWAYTVCSFHFYFRLLYNIRYIWILLWLPSSNNQAGKQKFDALYSFIITLHTVCMYVLYVCAYSMCLLNNTLLYTYSLRVFINIRAIEFLFLFRIAPRYLYIFSSSFSSCFTLSSLSSHAELIFIYFMCVYREQEMPVNTCYCYSKYKIKM